MNPSISAYEKSFEFVTKKSIFFFLKVASWLQLCRIVEGEDGVAEGGCEVRTAFAPLDDDFGNVLKRLHHVFRLAHVHKAYGCSDNAGRTSLPLANEVAELHEGRWSIAKGKERIWMFLDSQTDTGLRSGKTHPQPLPRGGEFG